MHADHIYPGSKERICERKGEENCWGVAFKNKSIEPCEKNERTTLVRNSNTLSIVVSEKLDMTAKRSELLNVIVFEKLPSIFFFPLCGIRSKNIS